MKLFFDDKIPKAEKEYKKIMSNKDIAREKKNYRFNNNPRITKSSPRIRQTFMGRYIRNKT